MVTRGGDDDDDDNNDVSVLASLVGGGRGKLGGGHQGDDNNESASKGGGQSATSRTSRSAPNALEIISLTGELAEREAHVGLAGRERRPTSATGLGALATSRRNLGARLAFELSWRRRPSLWWPLIAPQVGAVVLVNMNYFSLSVLASV